MTPRIRTIETRSILTPTKIPRADYAANPYIGCTHACRYCYACFMKRFTHHPEPWGGFLDVKYWPPLKNPDRYKGKHIILSTVTDPYPPQEVKFGRTRALLSELRDSGAIITLLTKSHLVLHDLDLLKQLEHVSVAFSINTLDETFKRQMEVTPPIQARLRAMRELRRAGVHTAVFISPIFPGITDVFAIADAINGISDEVWIENLNLRGSYRSEILRFIAKRYPELVPLYHQIYTLKDRSYWQLLAAEFKTYTARLNLPLINYFYHEEIRQS